MTGGHRRILVVEDDPETAGQLMEQLMTSGYQVDLASSGNEALSHGAAHDYAVITIDRMLPDIDGIAVMRQLRDGGVAAPFLIISALGEVDDKVRGLRAGGDDYLSSLSPSSSCWRDWKRLAGAATPSPRRRSCASAISQST
jgi:two-component system OmpR family response regulator